MIMNNVSPTGLFKLKKARRRNVVYTLFFISTFLPHFWAGVSHVHAYACLCNAYRLTSHGQGA